MGQPLRKLELRNSLFRLLQELSFKRGSVTLASGRESDFYFDMKPTMLHPEGAAELSELILDNIQDLDADCVGGLEMGAVPLIAPVAVKSLESNRPLHGFFVRKKPKQHGTKQRIEGRNLAGKRVVILDDVTTTGESAMDAVSAVREAGAEVILVLSIVDRGEGAAELYRNADIKFRSLFRAEEFLAAAD